MICEGTVAKYSCGRSTGFQFRNWRTRHLSLSRKELKYSESREGEAKLSIPTPSISVVWEAPTPRDHSAADPKRPMILLRFWAKGVYDLLIDCKSEDEKTRWLAGLRSALEPFKGVQFVPRDTGAAS